MMKELKYRRYQYWLNRISNFELGPSPPILSISSKNPNELNVSWTPHCNSLTECPHNRIPEKYIITYKPVNIGSGRVEEFTEVVESPDPAHVFPDTGIKLTRGITPSTKNKVSAVTKILYISGNGVKAICNDKAIETGTTSTFLQFIAGRFDF